MQEEYLKIDEVLKIIKKKKTTLYAYIARGDFPKPIKVFGNSLWLKSEVDKFMISFVEQRDKKQNQFRAVKERGYVK
ncbi:MULTISPECIES: helix-turn-helix transcriptional regulator [Francisella]|uniref:Prophage CP4-57 regulatory family protein n=1 Tax=Francisella philomiragia TaxID=28110 RepID=A0A0B6D585_9GAMM|nr:MULTISPECIES: AlpA family phage regulatory protein [Francisella]AJI52833.1 prophage CP4-57 regulatory family protein [Francisella philomiragia]MBK2093744.1 AlpA family phage regulatory protein [Francisella philomiragia]MBK2108970.1 AlpA family phage regulatory protein [Francisella tularensis subsp. novicida FSC595]